MSSELDELQPMIIADARKVYSDTVIDHAMNPRSMGDIRDADGFARVTGPCGDTMAMWIRVRDEIITDISFMTDGCGATIASGSMVSEMARGNGIREGLRITQRDVLAALGGLPEESKHCALLAANTLRAAIEDYLATKREPWKRIYRSHGRT